MRIALMRLSELFLVEHQDEEEEVLSETAKIAYAKSGNKVVRKYRCSQGPRQGRIVNSPADCNKPIDLKKRMKLRQTKAAKGRRMALKSKRTKQRNPASQRVSRLNKSS